MRDYEDIARNLRIRAKTYEKTYDEDSLLKESADAIEELSKLAYAIHHVCECCIGCEVESGGCDNAFVLSPKRAREYMNKPRWIPVTERLPLYGQDVLATRVFGDGEKCQEILMAHVAVWNEETGEKWWNATNITHWMPLPEPPKEDTK